MTDTGIVHAVTRLRAANPIISDSCMRSWLAGFLHGQTRQVQFEQFQLLS